MTRTVEIFIVSSVIGLIGLVSGFAVLSARSHTRDVLRLANVREIQMSLELYFQNHSEYPITTAPIALGQVLTTCLSAEGFSAQCASSGPTPYLEVVAVPPTAGLKGKVACDNLTDVYCYSGSTDQFRIEFELESANALLEVAKGANCLTETGFKAGVCEAL